MNLKRNIVLLLCMALSILILGCPMDTGTDPDTGTEPDGGSTPTIEGSNEDILKSLGFDLDLDEPVDDYGNDVGDRNPLGSSVYTYMKIDELFVAGADISGNRVNLFDDQDEGFAGLHSDDYSSGDTTTLWMNEPKKSVAADVDGDGYDELVTVIFFADSGRIQFQVLDHNDNDSYTVNLDNQDSLDTLSNPDWAFEYYFERDITAGDFDGDGKSDFAVTCGDTLYILDNTFAVQVSETFDYKNGGTNYCFLRVEAGNLNGDEYADLVVVNGTELHHSGEYFVFAGSSGGIDISDSELSGVLSGDSAPFCSAEVGLGDFNGDGLDEILFAGVEYRTDDTINCSVALIDPYEETDNDYEGKFAVNYMADDYRYISAHAWTGGVYPTNLYIPMTAVGDFDGDGIEEFLATDEIFRFNKTDGIIELFDRQIYSSSDSFDNNMYYDLATAGDITGNGIDEIIYIKAKDLPWTNLPKQHSYSGLYVWGKNSSGNYGTITSMSVTSDEICPTLAPANVDDDSFIVRFNRRELEFSEPVILAVLASAPYTTSPAMDIGDSETSFTLTSGHDESKSYSNGFYFDVNVGATLEWSTGVKFSLKEGYATSDSFSWGFGESHGETLDYGYSNSAGRNMVLCSAIPIDVYVYDIVNLVDGLISDGDEFTISIPREAQNQFFTVEAYNSCVTEKNRIPDSLLTHTVGDPSSYYTKTEKEGFAAKEEGFFSTQTQSVANGGGTTSITYSESASNFNTYNYDLTIGHYIGGTIAVLELESEQGYSYGYSYEYNVSKGIEISGVVGSLGSADWNAGRFNWGLMMIPAEIEYEGEATQSFNLVTYWVE